MNKNAILSLTLAVCTLTLVLTACGETIMVESPDSNKERTTRNAELVVIESTNKEVDDWSGIVVSTDNGAEYDDIFIRQDLGQEIRMGIDSLDEEIRAQIESVRDSNQTIHVWGNLLTDVPDVNSTQVNVSRIEIIGLPDPLITGLPVIAWYGYVVSLPNGTQFDDKVILHPAGAGQFGIGGASPEIDAQIIALRDKSDPGKNVHFWGQLICDVPDVNGCQLYVDKLLIDGTGETSGPIMVEGWWVSLVSTPDMPQVDDAVVLVGDYPVQFGIWSLDEALSGQLDELRDSGIDFQIWGEMICGVMDAGGCQIQPTQIKIP